MLHIPTSNIGLITVIILIGVMLASTLTFKSQFENPDMIFKEEPLEKNTKLQIHPGEEYKYNYDMNYTEINLTYYLSESEGCTRIFIEESVNNSNICIDEWGMDHTRSNSTFGNPSFILFKPWMLALHEVWRWNNSMYIMYDNAEQHVSDNYYRVMRTEIYEGRDTYVVAINSSTGPEEYLWIDANKRVLLRMLGQGYELKLIELPNNN